GLAGKSLRRLDRDPLPTHALARSLESKTQLPRARVDLLAARARLCLQLFGSLLVVAVDGLAERAHELALLAPQPVLPASQTDALPAGRQPTRERDPREPGPPARAVARPRRRPGEPPLRQSPRRSHEECGKPQPDDRQDGTGDPVPGRQEEGG